MDFFYTYLLPLFVFLGVISLVGFPFPCLFLASAFEWIPNTVFYFNRAIAEKQWLKGFGYLIRMAVISLPVTSIVIIVVSAFGYSSWNRPSIDGTYAKVIQVVAVYGNEGMRTYIVEADLGYGVSRMATIHHPNYRGHPSVGSIVLIGSEDLGASYHNWFFQKTIKPTYSSWL